MTAKIRISLYHGPTEKSYTTFTLPAEGDDARELLTTKTVNNHTYSVSDQFGLLGGDLDAARAVGTAILRGRYDDAAKIAAANPYRY